MRHPIAMAAAGVGALALMTGGMLIVADADTTATPTPSSSTSAAPATDQQTREALVWLSEEERLAKDLYTAFAEKYPDARIFERIARSEKRHEEAVKRLLERRGIDDPAEGLKAGDYADDKLDKLYSELLAAGSESVEKAYEAGKKVEVADIDDLRKLQSATSDDDIQRVIGHLLRGSERHLDAFTRAANGEEMPDHDGMGPGRDGERGGQGRGPGEGHGRDGDCDGSGGDKADRPRRGGGEGQGPRGERDGDDADRPGRGERLGDGTDRPAWGGRQRGGATEQSSQDEEA